RYKIAREPQDQYGVQSQQRAAAAQAAGRFSAEIAPIEVVAGVADRDSGRLATKTLEVDADVGIRADTTYEAVAKIRAATPGGVIAAGNASQFSGGVTACVVMSDARAAQLNLAPMGIFRSFAIAGCEPDEMGIGPVFAV